MTGDLARAATDVLLANWTGRHTVPSRSLYPHQWSWDSAFIAIGLRHLSPRRAQRELESLFGAQWPDGRVPQIVFDPDTAPEAYFPGADFWGGPSAGLVQPPMHAVAAWATFQAGPQEARRRAFLQRLYPKLAAWHRYLTERRGTGDAGGLVHIVHPWESGMDNSPAWDEPLHRVAPVPVVRFTRRDLQHARAAERPTDVDYGRYVRLAEQYRDAGCADAPDGGQFRVADPMFNALLAAAELAMADIATEIGADPGPHRERAARVTGALGRLLRDGLFHHLDLHTGALSPHRTVAGLVPLILPDLPAARAVVKTAVGEQFHRPGGVLVPSYDLTAAGFDPVRYWRGPAWFNTTWLVWRGLTLHGELTHADRLRDTMLATAATAGFREYFDPLTGTGHGTGDFGWTAALTLDLLRSAS